MEQWKSKWITRGVRLNFSEPPCTLYLPLNTDVGSANKYSLTIEVDWTILGLWSIVGCVASSRLSYQWCRGRGQFLDILARLI